MTQISYQKLVDVYEEISENSARLTKIDIISNFLKEIQKTDPKITYDVVLLLQGKIFPPWSEEEMGISTQLIIKTLSKLSGENTKKIEDKLAQLGDIGEVAEQIVANNKQMTFFSIPLTVKKVIDNLRKTCQITGSNSQNKKLNLILELYTSSSASEAKYITRTITERLRIGVGEGTMVDAIAKAYGIDKQVVDRAYMLSNDLGEVAKRALISEEDVKKITITPGKPIKPMLAQLSEGIKESICEIGHVIAETKYDGIRIQIHHVNGKTTMYTRQLENVTEALPEVVEYLDEAMPDEDYIIEGEIIATRDNKPISFQYILQRVKRKYDIERMRNEIPLKLFVFDMLYYRRPMAEEMLIERREMLEEVLKETKKVELSNMCVVSSENYQKAIDLFNWSVENNHEGIMLKNANSAYSPGKRGKNMLKYKPVRETLDCVITGATYGKGKRAKFFGSYELSLYDHGTGEYKTLVHAATGLDDETLESLTKRMEQYVTHREETNVTIEPKVILEVAYSEIVESNEYETGYSLRFPAIKGVRDDLRLDEVDSTDKLMHMLKLQNK